MRFVQLLLYLYLATSAFAEENVLIGVIKGGEEHEVIALLQQREFSSVEQAAALQTSVSAEKTSILARMLDHGFSPDAVKDDGFNATALMFAAYKNNIEMMDILVNAGADMNKQDGVGDPAINWAAFAGHTDAVNWLLEKGARTDLVGHGNTLEIAMRRGFTEIVNALCKKQACHEPTLLTRQLMLIIDDPDAHLKRTHTLSDFLRLDDTGRPLLHRASRQGRVELLEFVSSGTSPEHLKNALDIRDTIGFTALMEAAREGQFDTVKWLIERGADINTAGSKNALSLTALHLAALSGHADIVTLLANHHADLNARDTDGNTAAMWAYFSEQKEIARLLIRLGTDIELTNRFGNRLPADINE